MNTNKKVDWFSSTGFFIRAADSFGRSFQVKMRALSLGEKSHMRIGRFAVVMVSRPGQGELDLIAGEKYAVHNIEEPLCDVRRGSRFWEAHRNDRGAQCAAVANVLDGLSRAKREHPLHDEIMKDVKREQNYLR